MTCFTASKAVRATAAYPEAALLNVKGTFYGTTYGGGASGGGTVFKITRFGTETVLYSFESGGDGNLPEAGLINVNRTLYGTTYGGGKDGDGTVFAITTSGKETVLHSFGAGPNDGIYPIASLISVKGTLYSTTYEGGKNGDGTVFKITPSDKETVLHSFGTGSRDGSGPRAGLLNVKGTVYGTTSRGGRNGDGTVFVITPSGTEIVLHNFKGVPDGEYPYAGLINVNDTFYGTTYFGGAYDGGTVFSITTSGKATVLHSFGMTGDGEYPYAGLINVKGTLYGTTYEGGEGQTKAEPSSQSQRPARKPCSIASRAPGTANTRMRASSTSAARSTARPSTGAQTTGGRSSRYRHEKRLR